MPLTAPRESVGNGVQRLFHSQSKGQDMTPLPLPSKLPSS